MKIVPQNTNCGKCSSADTQKTSMAYNSGTSQGQVVALTYSDGDALGIARGRTKTQTLLAKQLAPPAEPAFLAGLLIPLVAGGVVGFLVFFAVAVYTHVEAYGFLAAGLVALAVIIGSFWKITRSYEGQMAEYKKAFWRWNNSWVCLRCGHTWLPRASEAVKVA